MVTVMKSRTTDVRIFLSDLVDFPIYRQLAEMKRQIEALETELQ
jgi:hypothetical protein